ncbi:MAG TPA: response regulator, partial [Acidimicrobiales bacterium]|nr:response regulator [Acidimicrobiales bacterium]
MSELDPKAVDHRVRWSFGVASALVVAYFVSLVARSTGSYYAPVDGWGVSCFELAMGALCIRRYFDRTWRASPSAANVFPIVMGAACIAWALGDLTLTVETLGGATVAVPSAADAFYFGFYPLCFISIMLVIRRGNSGSLVATSMDGVIAGLGVASLSAAYLFDWVLRHSGATSLSTAVNMAYPVGDLLLAALVVGGLTILTKEYKRFLLVASVALGIDLIGDAYNLLQPNSKVGYLANAVAWPISLLLLAMATWLQPSTARTRAITAREAGTEKKAGFVIPVLGTLGAMVVLLTSAIGSTTRPALAMAVATLLAAGIRVALTIREARTLSSARFRSLIDNTWDLIVVTEADLRVAYITPSSQRILGTTPGELQGRPLSDLLHPDDAETLNAQLGQLGARPGEASAATIAVETRVRHRSGRWRTVAWTATNLLDDPSVRGYVLNGADVTETREALDNLAAARDGALMASKAKSESLATMSHEIRTPMNGVIGLTELLLETGLDTDQRELASGVKVSAEKLLVIINDILDFSKIEAGKLELEEAAFEVHAVADDVGRILAEAANAKGVELLIDVHPDVPVALLGDAVRVQQVLLNLGSNAVKFSAENEVVIRVSVLHENAERAALRFEVVDHGIGIAPEDQERLFEAFSQADSSTTRKFGGTGLGLAICRQLIELMGGRLGLVSAPGEGSTFWFELSFRRATEAPGQKPGAENLAGLRALVVDDNATNRTILDQRLASWGVEAEEAVDAYEALALAAAAAEAGRPFDFGVIDLQMPSMDGIELARALKADPATAAMPLFLLSSSGNRLGAAECHLRGFAASLTKPVRASELFECLGQHLGGLVDTETDTDTDTDTDSASTDSASAERGAPGSHVLESRGVVLLVDDNPTNQLVGSKVLAKLGYRHDIAGHGGEAVAAVTARRYDAVLMDCQMPEMDGYAATAEIRRLEGTARHTPIIAMTAAAMEGDRDACLAAGMDDYVTKPVRSDIVAAVLERWVADAAPDAASAKRDDAPDAASPASGPPGPDQGPDPLDPTQVELLRSLDDGDGVVLGEI